MKRRIGVIFSLALVIIVALGVILPVSLAEPNEVKEKEPKRITYYAGQVAYAAESTGAAEAGSNEKGGVHYLGKGATYTMTGGTISGQEKTYGGAVFVDSNATFIMYGGTICGCGAKYGGAIYVASGGTCVINGGNIKNNKAEVAPAIYVEDGGTLEIGGNAEITANILEKWVNITISETKENVGGLNSGLELYTTTLGSYPQTYVGDSMREELENWFNLENPVLVKTYKLGDGTEWKTYNYNGDLYVRGTETKYSSDSVYKDGTLPTTGRISWFKVEPIKWYILNYDEWKSGKEKIELYSTQVLAAKTPFNSTTSKGNHWSTSDIRAWCNYTFYNDAFSLKEQSAIQATTLKNNVAGESEEDPSTWTGEDTEDKIYLKTYYELRDSKGLFTNPDIKRLCSGTDFAIGNNLNCSYRSTDVTNYSVTCGYYWLRSAPSSTSHAHIVYVSGSFNTFIVQDTYVGIRPALRLSV